MVSHFVLLATTATRLPLRLVAAPLRGLGGRLIQTRSLSFLPNSIPTRGWTAPTSSSPSPFTGPVLGSLMSRRSMFIRTETTPNQDSLKFVPGEAVLPEGQSGTLEFLDMRSARASPLAKALLMVDGVTGVFFGRDFITVTKDQDTPWQLLKPDIYGAIMDFYSSGQPIVFQTEDEMPTSPRDTQILPDDSEVVQMIKELLDTRIRPSIQEDGGDIEYIGFNEGSGVVQLALKGACRTCSSSVITLKNGIENMLMHYIPEVTSVEQVETELDKLGGDEFAKFEKSLETKP
ncbi:hypothetical protein H4R33_002873 [Dimargaris cristalligena]|nr:hypothetical protein H4R33_002873 [Dimargaris cristalligena]